MSLIGGISSGFSKTYTKSDPIYEKQEDPEEEYWEKTKNTHTVDAYKKYLLLSEAGRFTGKYKEVATKAISDIWDETAWARAKKLGTKAAYKEYIENEPFGKHKKEALSFLRPAPRTRSANSSAPPPAAKKPVTVAARAPKAKPKRILESDGNIDVSRIPLMYEDSVWNSSIEWDSELAYMNYVDQFPAGSYLDEALHKVPIKISIVRSNESLGKSSFSLAYAKNPVIISKIEIDRHGNNSRFNAMEMMKSLLRSVNLQGDSVYTYSLKEQGLVARLDMPKPVESKVVIQANKSSAFKVQFRDALGRTAEIALEAAAEEFKIAYISGYSIDEDTLYFKIKGGKPEYAVQFFELDRYVVRHEATLIKDHLRGDPELWYLDKKRLQNEAELIGEYYLTIWDKSHEKFIEHNRIVHFNEGLFSNIEDIILFLIIIMFLILPASWLYIRHKNSKMPKFEPIR